MQYLNNDMDELMRRAAVHYPVQPTGQDWQKVAELLQKEDAGTVADKKINGSKILFFLTLFLLAGLACDKYFIRWYHVVPAVFYGKENKISNSTPLPVNTSAEKAKKESKHAAVATKIFKRWSVAGKDAFEITHTTKENKEIRIESKFEKAVEKETNKNKDFVKATTTPFGNDSTGAIRPTIATEEKEGTKHAVIEGRKTAAVITVKEGNDKKWYAGIMAGPDVSTVKLQKVKATGYSIALVSGYAFHKKWAAETGLVWSRKQYYSKGAYFKTDKIALPNHATIINAEGYCDMFEIPVNLRYNFIQKEKHKLFLLTGVSSYLMQKEEYDYLYKRYGNEYRSNKYYKQASRDWMSVMNLSAGYELTIQSIGTLRIEPYVKLPLRGVGVGSLPLSSAGLQLGITRNIR